MRSVGLTGGEDKGGGGEACSAGSTTASPASLEKRCSGGMPLRAARVPEAWPLASGRPAVVAGLFTLAAERGGPDGGEDEDLLRRWPATGEEARGATGTLAGDAENTLVVGGEYSSRGKEHKTPTPEPRPSTHARRSMPHWLPGCERVVFGSGVEQVSWE
jgi:hypothetical protein